jgi:membrane-associated phospholipid phosphatase
LTRIRKVVADNIYFILPFILVIITATFFLGIYGNNTVFLSINKQHSPFADVIFLNITHLGDGAIPFIVVLILLLFSFREAFTFLAITLILIIIVTVLKRAIFPEFYRPVEYFGTSEVIRLINGYDPPLLYTFPSGHSATAYSIFLYLSFLIRNNWLKFSLFIFAFSVSYSRIYLSAHFPADAVAGSLIAVSVTVLIYSYSRQIQTHWMDKKMMFKPGKQF